MEQIPSFNALIEKSIIDNWDLDSLTDYKGKTLQYHDVARKIEKLHIMFEASGVQRGDKIALCGRNSAAWSCRLPRHPHLWRGGRAHPPRVHARPGPQHRQPQRRQAPLHRRRGGHADRRHEDALDWRASSTSPTIRSWSAAPNSSPTPANTSTRCLARSIRNTFASSTSTTTASRAPTSWPSSTTPAAPPGAPRA